MPPWVLFAVLIIVILIIIWILISGGPKETTKTTVVEEAETSPELATEAVDSEIVEEEIQELTEEEAASIDEDEIIDVEVFDGEADDLKVIEGIGPKIAGILAENGIHTFEQLASMDEGVLKYILVENKIRIANPATWMQQAKLAAEGKWEELDALQQTLTAGRMG